MGIWGTLGKIGKAALPFAGPIGSIAGGAMDMISQSHANKANAQNVDKQLAFQKSQSETQYQRATADMEAAGLNPALAYQQGGNAAESGAAATAQPISQNSAAKFSTAMQAYQDFATGAASRNLLNQQADVATAQAEKTRKESLVLTPAALLGQSGDYQAEYGHSEYAKRRAEKFTAERTEPRYEADIALTRAGTAQSLAAAKEARTRSTLNEQDFQNAWFRQKISPYLNSTSKAIRTLYGGH